MIEMDKIEHKEALYLELILIVIVLFIHQNVHLNPYLLLAYFI